MIVSYTLSLKNPFILSITSIPKLVLENIVRRTPSISKLGLTFLCASIIVLISCIIPSRAKYSHWTGINTESAAASALVVRIPRDGGQSINIKS